MCSASDTSNNVVLLVLLSGSSSGRCSVRWCHRTLNLDLSDICAQSDASPASVGASAADASSAFYSLSEGAADAVEMSPSGGQKQLYFIRRCHRAVRKKVASPSIVC